MMESSSLQPARDPARTRAWIVGGGIAGLASAAYLLQAGRVRGDNISILEEADLLGASLDAHGAPEHGYVTRGGRLFDDRAYSCTFDLMSFIPSLADPYTSVKQEFSAFNEENRIHAQSRLVSDGDRLDMSSPGFGTRDRLALVALMGRTESSLSTQRIDDCFDPAFFETPFWWMWCTSFEFNRWHSAAEFRRHLLRFIHELPHIGTLAGMLSTPFNPYDSIVRPLTSWLQAQGVRFQMNTCVTALDFKAVGDETRVERLRTWRDGAVGDIAIGENDLVFATLGSTSANATVGSMDRAPEASVDAAGGAWSLWHAVARWRPEFGRPTVFDGHVGESTGVSFSMTFHGPRFFRMMDAFTGNAAGTGGLVSFRDSNWGMSIVLPHQPHFINQPDDVSVAWGRGLLPAARGNYVDKRMLDCSGAEILAELFAHLHFDANAPGLGAEANCIPCVMPFLTSPLLVRAVGDRPAVVPKGALNFAFIGQFCEIPDDVAFTIEYSVRSAQTAVFTLLGLDRPVSPLYKGYHDPRVLLATAEVLLG